MNNTPRNSRWNSLRIVGLSMIVVGLILVVAYNFYSGVTVHDQTSSVGVDRQNFEPTATLITRNEEPAQIPSIDVQNVPTSIPAEVPIKSNETIDTILQGGQALLDDALQQIKNAKERFPGYNSDGQYSVPDKYKGQDPVSIIKGFGIWGDPELYQSYLDADGFTGNITESCRGYASIDSPVVCCWWLNVVAGLMDGGQVPESEILEACPIYDENRRLLNPD